VKRVRAELLDNGTGGLYLHNPFDYEDKVTFIHPHSGRKKQGTYKRKKGKRHFVIHYGDSVCNEAVVRFDRVIKESPWKLMPFSVWLNL